MRRGLVRTTKVLGLTLALTVVLGAVAPSARATWTPRRDMLGWMNNARSGTARSSWTGDGGSGRWRTSTAGRWRTPGGSSTRRPSAPGSRSCRGAVAGENVGAGLSMRTLYEAFMDSDGHRDNILERRFRRVGIGVYAHDGFLWVTMIFVG